MFFIVRTGVNERKKLKQNVDRISTCDRDVIEFVGPYNINEIYSFAIEKWGADQRLIDLGLMRTKEAEETVLPRTDIDDQRKRELVIKMRNGELGEQAHEVKTFVFNST